MASQLVFPFPAGQAFTWERVDAGQDLQTNPGGYVVAIAPGTVREAHDVFGGFGPFYPEEDVTDGPLRGKTVYYGHTKITRTGHVNAGDVIAVTQANASTWTAAPAGWLEIGFLPYGRGNVGGEMASVLHGIAGGGGFTSILNTPAPPPPFNNTAIGDAIKSLNWAGFEWNLWKTWYDQSVSGYYASATAANDIMFIDKFIR